MLNRFGLSNTAQFKIICYIPAISKHLKNIFESGELEVRISDPRTDGKPKNYFRRFERHSIDGSRRLLRIAPVSISSEEDVEFMKQNWAELAEFYSKMLKQELGMNANASSIFKGK